MVYKCKLSSAEILIEAEDAALSASAKGEHRSSFETFKSNIRHHVKDMGDLDLIIHTLETDEIRSEEAESRQVLLDFQENYPGVAGQNNINDILKAAKAKKAKK